MWLYIKSKIRMMWPYCHGSSQIKNRVHSEEYKVSVLLGGEFLPADINLKQLFRPSFFFLLQEFESSYSTYIAIAVLVINL